MAENVRKSASDAVDKASSSVQDTVKKATDAASDAGGKILDAAPGVAAMVESGSADLSIGTNTHTFAGSYCRVVSVSPKHGSVLQLRSYASLDAERFPSYFFQAQTDNVQLSGLVGSELAGQLFVQLKQDGPVWHSGNEPVVAKFDSIDGSTLVGKFASGQLQSPDMQIASASGQFSASIQE
ncbi:MAG: hypothetical protein Aurels2KO_17300 [Aureliella sp.]